MVILYYFRFDYGEKFWVIKHKFFTCHCASEKCRYSRTNITNFLREYYKRNGEPLPPELVPTPKEEVKKVSTKEDIKTEAKVKAEVKKQGSKVKNKDKVLDCDKKNQKNNVENDTKKVPSEKSKVQNENNKLHNNVKKKK